MYEYFNIYYVYIGLQRMGQGRIDHPTRQQLPILGNYETITLTKL
jgi:hypothetical protein